jgi:hypothetical protein
MSGSLPTSVFFSGQRHRRNFYGLENGLNFAETKKDVHLVRAGGTGRKDKTGKAARTETGKRKSFVR